MSMILSQKEFLTTREAAKALGLHNSRIQQLCRNGQLCAQKLGSAWMVSAEAVQERKQQGRAGMMRPGPKPKALNTAVGKEIRARRSAAGLSLSDLAKRVGVSRAYISALELGHYNCPEKMRERCLEAR
jgi:excisionase family DNA binding protein